MKCYFEEYGGYLDVQELSERCVSYLGVDGLLEALLLALSTEELQENLQYIADAHDIPTRDLYTEYL